MRIVILGLSITSSWGNGHATTYRALVRALASRGHDVLFLERDAPWYAENRDLPEPPYACTRIYSDAADLKRVHGPDVAGADVVVVGSYVPDGAAVGDLVHGVATGITAFYDIDTPVTLARLEHGDTEYLTRRQIPRYDVYLSFTGGPTLERLERKYGARAARPLYCSVDPDVYFSEPDAAKDYDLGYLGTYSADRQPALTRLLLRPAARWPEGRFVIAGPQYPDSFTVPANVDRVMHLSPAEHRAFYNRLRFTLNVTRADMVKAGYSPSVRLFEAGACGTPIVSDDWKGLDRFFMPGEEILLARNAKETLAFLRDIPEDDRIAIGRRARARVLCAHTADRRAIEFEEYVAEARGSARPSTPAPQARIA